MFSVLRTLLRNVYPIERLSLEPGKRANIYHWPWIQIGLTRLFFQLDVRLLLCFTMAAYRA